ncbi:MAG TPA: hypothetical protein VK686_20815, partial [Bryobacteraceae bacterium]|nr:hypothetical protein [Bryobacteraceae bacterium]
MNKKRFSHVAISIPARSSILAIGLVVLLASTFAVASTPQGRFEKTFQVSGPVDLEVQTRSGDITVRSGFVLPDPPARRLETFSRNVPAEWK